MKMFNSILLISCVVLLAGCSPEQSEPGQSTANHNESAVEHGLKHQDPTYVCPMHPQIIRDKPGNCPICGMDLALKEADQEESGERKILYYKHPHNPTITSDKPMKDEMGMDYVPVYDDGGGVSVKISPAVENNMGVRTAQAERGRLWRRIDTVGYVDFDENKISHIHLRTKGWIEKLYVKSEGERVNKGQLLFEVYSPELVNAQEEYLQALRTGNRSLISASADRLVALGISKRQISALKDSNKARQYVSVFASQDGIVAKLNIREGMYVQPMREVMSLADLSTIWILAEVFESQAGWVKVGQFADVKLSYLPGRVWEGKVEYIYPSLNPKTRTLKVRLRFDNPDESLKPNMFANVTIYGGAKTKLIYIPREALIRAGAEDRVIIAQGEGRFAPRKVTAGIESGDYVEIISGLRVGETVVTSGQFLIDSEASLKASLQRMSSPDNQSSVDSQPDTGKMVHASGKVTAVEPANNRIKIAHDPIDALGWPDMDMYFDVAKGVPLDKFNKDDVVTFMLEQGDSGYVITSMSKSE